MILLVLVIFGHFLWCKRIRFDSTHFGLVPLVWFSDQWYRNGKVKWYIVPTLFIKKLPGKMMKRHFERFERHDSRDFWKFPGFLDC